MKMSNYFFSLIILIWFIDGYIFNELKEDFYYRKARHKQYHKGNGKHI